ncbi:MAG: hypothetical protein Ct9H300mP16_13230 [Pseudomonadota bacterium]|nr:MAG: hypothetical protein Ct9H300mP16_13230 [Pseudomonadota bacterium]
MTEEIRLVIHGVESAEEIPGIDRFKKNTQFIARRILKVFSSSPEAEALLGWNFRATELREAWPLVDSLRWIQWGGAGVDAVLFPELVASDVLLTNVRGVFDRARAEYTLALILAFGKELPETYAAQREHRWSYRWTELPRVGRCLWSVSEHGSRDRPDPQADGFRRSGVGRSARDSDLDFGKIHAVSDLDRCLQRWTTLYWYTIDTPDPGLFGAAQFSAMKPSARFINLGRGELVDEAALLERSKTIRSRVPGLMFSAPNPCQPRVLLGSQQRDRLSAYVR